MDFVRSLIQAGANAITIHGRIVGDESQTDARWDTLVDVVKHLKESESVPIVVNGDLYTHADIREMNRRSRCDGVMLARPALYNLSLFKSDEATDGKSKGDAAAENDDTGNNPVEIPLSQFQTSHHSGYYGYASPLLTPRNTIIKEYISHCVRYRAHSKNAKYVVCEMMNARRAPTSRVPFLDMRNEQSVADVCKCRSLDDLVKVWDVKWTIPLPSVGTDSAAGEGGEVLLHNYDDRYFLEPEKFAAEAGAKLQECEDEKKTEESGDSTPPAKRPKL